MIVQPDFADHWKTELLIRLCGSETAVRCLLRFWSHCQNRKQWEFTNLTPEVLASICRWTGDAQVFWDAMNQTFLDRVGDVYAAHEWGDINSQLTHNWNVGKLGGRPKKTQGFPQGLPKGSDRDNPTETQGITLGVTLGVTDRLDREDKIEEKGNPEDSQPAKAVKKKKSVSTMEVDQPFLDSLKAEYQEYEVDVDRQAFDARQWIKANPDRGRVMNQQFFRNWMRNGKFPRRRPKQTWAVIETEAPSLDELHRLATTPQ